MEAAPLIVIEALRQFCHAAEAVSVAFVEMLTERLPVHVQVVRDYYLHVDLSLVGVNYVDALGHYRRTEANDRVAHNDYDVMADG